MLGSHQSRGVPPCVLSNPVPGAASSKIAILFPCANEHLPAQPWRWWLSLSCATQLCGKAAVDLCCKQEVVLPPRPHVMGRGGLVEGARVWVCNCASGAVTRGTQEGCGGSWMLWLTPGFVPFHITPSLAVSFWSCPCSALRCAPTVRNSTTGKQW